MSEINAPGTDGITLDVDPEFTYAQTSNETLRVIRFFLEELKPVDTADIEPEDGNCAICTQTFTTGSHPAVRLPCNHMFGKPCIEQWLRPYVSSMPEHVLREQGLSLGANTCPQCRREFFPRQRIIDNLMKIEKRVRFWDMAYAHIGIALSHNERRAREDLLRYLRSYDARGADIYHPDQHITKHWTKFPEWSQMRLLAFSLRLQRQSLSPEQETLRQRLENHARCGFPGGVTCWKNDCGEMLFAVGPEIKR